MVNGFWEMDVRFPATVPYAPAQPRRSLSCPGVVPGIKKWLGRDSRRGGRANDSQGGVMKTSRSRAVLVCVLLLLVAIPAAERAEAFLQRGPTGGETTGTPEIRLLCLGPAPTPRGTTRCVPASASTCCSS